MTRTESELDAWLAFALACCDEADALAMAHFRRDLVIQTKPDRSFVTEADQAIERGIRDRIVAAYPDHGLVGEEYGDEAGHGSVTWYIDPIDGTHNFMRGVPLFGTLLALEADGELEIGVMSAPALGGRWFARRGGGAWAVGSIGADAGVRRPIRVSRVARLADAHLLYGSAQEIADSGEAPGFPRLIGDVWRDRGFGDFWGYALVAEGAAEAMVEVGPKSWDLAAPLVIIEEAGGRLTDLEGRRTIHSGTVLATNGPLHDEILARLRS
ncbi:MAG TPA: inositol monophosphatase family protein [Candidatus Limnocylindrales bacterium]